MRPIELLRVLGFGVALAGSVVCTSGVPASAQAYAGQVQSNQALDSIANRINQDIAALVGDDTDYGRHRVRAIGLMRRAHGAIAAAEEYAASHGAGAGAVNPGAADAARGGVVRRPQASSAENIVAVRNDLQALVNEMRATPEDYGGHRTAAANDLATAVVELGNALEYRQTHR